jgi:hypothetical protein
MAGLTLYHGDAAAEFTEHPVEVARRALREAADHEERSGGEDLAGLMRRLARLMPRRGPIRKGDL